MLIKILVAKSLITRRIAVLTLVLVLILVLILSLILVLILTLVLVGILSLILILILVLILILAWVLILITAAVGISVLEKSFRCTAQSQLRIHHRSKIRRASAKSSIVLELISLPSIRS